MKNHPHFDAKQRPTTFDDNPVYWESIKTDIATFMHPVMTVNHHATTQVVDILLNLPTNMAYYVYACVISVLFEKVYPAAMSWMCKNENTRIQNFAKYGNSAILCLDF